MKKTNYTERTHQMKIQNECGNNTTIEIAKQALLNPIP